MINFFIFFFKFSVSLVKDIPLASVSCSCDIYKNGSPNLSAVILLSFEIDAGISVSLNPKLSTYFSASSLPFLFTASLPFFAS